MPSVVASATSDHSSSCRHGSFTQVSQPAASQQRFSRLVARSTIDDLEIQELVHKLDEMVSASSVVMCSICVLPLVTCSMSHKSGVRSNSTGSTLA
jgi:hypothetical protein